MATTELHPPPETSISTSPPPPTTTSAAAASPDPPKPDNHPTTTTTNAPKRQRRPSVRLGEIGGDPPYTTATTATNTKSSSWRFHKDPSFAAKTSKTRPLTNLVTTSENPNSNELADNTYLDFTTHHQHRKPKIKKPTRRARTNWNKFDIPSNNNNGVGGGGNSISFAQDDNETATNNEEEDDEGFRDFEGSESPKQSPVNSVEGLQFWHKRENNGMMMDDNCNEGRSSSVGVRDWLSGLGLGRYANVFEVHEVDDEVLPMLTLEDLKDMGISAVGSRRKMYASILKLRKGFS